MHAHNLNESTAAMMAAATDQQAMEALRCAREMFNRTLASWASDQLIVQRRGLDQPTWHGRGRTRFRHAA